MTMYLRINKEEKIMYSLFYAKYFGNKQGITTVVCMNIEK